VAKTRSKSRKSGASSTRAKGTKKPAGKRKTSAKRPPAGLDLKKLRRQIDLAMSHHARRLAASAVPGVRPDDTQAALSRLAAEIDQFCADGGCGPTMLVPFA
jgi:hypothetical protein